MRSIIQKATPLGGVVVAVCMITGGPATAVAADTAIAAIQGEEFPEFVDPVGDPAADAKTFDWEYEAAHGQERAKLAENSKIKGLDPSAAAVVKSAADWTVQVPHGGQLAQAQPRAERRNPATFANEMGEPLLLAAATPAAPEEDVNDPLEPMNRGIFAFNQFFLDWILGPISRTYKDYVPDLIREAIGNILDNVATPTILANDLLQAEFARAWQTTERVVINSTVGLGGMIDVADHIGIPKHNEDLGQTLAVWGVGEGFYLVLPFFGPSNPRDAIGKGVDSYFHPLTLWASNTHREEINYGLGSANAVHTYSTVMDELEQVRKTSVDYYAALRSMYRQKRAAEIRNGAEVNLPPIPEISYDVEEKPSGPTAGVGERPASERGKGPQS